MESYILKGKIFWFALASVLVMFMIVTKRMRAVRMHHQSREGWSLPVAEAGCPPSFVSAESSQANLQAGLLIVNEIVSAYSNAEDRVMLELVGKMPEGALRLQGEDHTKLLLPINQVWLRFFGNWKVDNPPLPTADFIRRIRAEMALSKVYGLMIVASGRTARHILVDIEWDMLKRLQIYQEVFVRESRMDCLAATEGFIKDWIQQIESEDGFTREYLRSQDRGLQPLIKRGLLTESELRKQVRLCIFPVSDQCGYTPKWLDEEFPPL